MKISFDALALAPAVVPMVGALLVLLVDVVLPGRARLPWVLAVLACLGGLGALIVGAVTGPHGTSLCDASGGCYWQADQTGVGLQGLALASAAVVAVLALAEKTSDVPGTKGHPAVRAMLVLAATAGCVGVVAARDLGSWLVLIELATIPSVALVALRGGRQAAHGALTLLVTALVSFAVLALGAAVWFAATGTASMTGDQVLDAFADPARKPLVVLAMMLVIAGVGFKLSLAPFHAWTPEAFEGSGSWVAAFLATTSKVGALGGMLVVLRAASSLGSSALTALAVVAALSMTVGNVMAWRQDGALRFMAWSTVAQAGWVVLPMTVVAGGSVTAAAAYLALYTIGTLAVFVVLAALEDARSREHETTIGDLRGLFRTRPMMAATLALGLLALAGLPPSIIGVVAKIVALKPVVAGGVWWLVVIALLNAVLGVAVYLRWIAAMFAPVATPAPENDDVSEEAAAVAALSGNEPELTPLPRPKKVYGVLAALVSLAVVTTSLAPNVLLALF